MAARTSGTVTIHTFHVNIDFDHRRLKRRTRADAARARVVNSAGVVLATSIWPVEEAHRAAPCTLEEFLRSVHERRARWPAAASAAG